MWRKEGKKKKKKKKLLIPLHPLLDLVFWKFGSLCGGEKKGTKPNPNSSSSM
jgi:hypothetical protein